MMKKLILAALISLGSAEFTIAQNSAADVNKVVDAEKSFAKLVERKGIKDGFLTVADPEGIIFKPNAVNITDFYNSIDKQAGTLTWQPNFARISRNGDLAFTAGPYVYQNGSDDTDKVYGDYVSVWRSEGDGNLKLLIDLGIQHPEPEQDAISDFKNPDSTTQVVPSKDPFSGKRIILATDNAFNHSLTMSTLASYKEFLSPEGRYYFPGFEVMTGQDKIMKFIDNEAITINAQTTNAGRSTSNDLAYTYGKARIKKGALTSDYNYVRIWELDATHKWDILLEVFSAVESE
jgi:ketosteroid isomerase-like protein